MNSHFNLQYTVHFTQWGKRTFFILQFDEEGSEDGSIVPDKFSHEKTKGDFLWEGRESISKFQ